MTERDVDARIADVRADILAALDHACVVIRSDERITGRAALALFRTHLIEGRRWGYTGEATAPKPEVWCDHRGPEPSLWGCELPPGHHGEHSTVHAYLDGKEGREGVWTWPNENDTPKPENAFDGWIGAPDDWILIGTDSITINGPGGAKAKGARECGAAWRGGAACQEPLGHSGFHAYMGRVWSEDDSPHPAKCPLCAAQDALAHDRTPACPPGPRPES